MRRSSLSSRSFSELARAIAWQESRWTQSARSTVGAIGVMQLMPSTAKYVAKKIGPTARPKALFVTPDLPKTRSGKIMRRVLKAVALDRDPGDISTSEDEGSVDEARRAVEEMRAGIVT